MYRRWNFTKHHLTGEVLKVWLHCQWQPKGVCEECLSGDLQQHMQNGVLQSMQSHLKSYNAATGVYQSLCTKYGVTSAASFIHCARI